jgi:hypothetical protein
MRVRAAVTVDHPEEIGRLRFKINRRLPEGRELIVTVGDFVLALSNPAARWLLAMLTAIIAPELGREGNAGPPAPIGRGVSLADGVRVRVEVAVHAHNPAEVGRPRWEQHELVVAIGDVVVYLSEPAARWLMAVLKAALPAEPEVSHGAGTA